MAPGAGVTGINPCLLQAAEDFTMDFTAILKIILVIK